MKETRETVITLESWSRAERLLLRFLGTVAFMFLAMLSAQVRIPLPFTPVPMTLQTFVAPLAGGFLGAACGSISMLMYLAFGLLGAPVFAQAAGGWQFFYSPTAGFLAGMVLAAWVMGRARNAARSNLQLLAALIGSHLLIFACGILGFMMNTGAGWNDAFAKAVAPFLFGDAIKITASYLVLISYYRFRKAARS